jgi:ankyrin repeat protein
MSALYQASVLGRLEVAKVLLNAGADVEGPPAEWGRTALMAASEKGHVPVVRELLLRGAVLNR